MARIRAAPVSRAVTAAPGVQPVSSSALAKEPERPKTAEENSAIAQAEAEEVAAHGALAEFGGRQDTGASCQE